MGTSQWNFLKTEIGELNYYVSNILDNFIHIFINFNVYYNYAFRKANFN